LIGDGGVLYGVMVTVSLYTDLSSMYVLAPQAVLLVYMGVKKGDDSTRHKCQWLLRYCTDAYSSICH
jgi:hypothetical protein